MAAVRRLPNRHPFDDRDRGARQARLRRLRRAGGVESRQAAPRLPLLRDGVARTRSTRLGRDPRDRPRADAARDAGGAARLEGREAHASAAAAATPSRSSTPSASVRTASSAARRSSSTTTRSRRRSARRACCRSRSDATRVRESLRRWFAGTWFAPRKLKTKALVDTVRGVYLPYWTFDAQVDCPWTAESGHYYYTTETYRDANGKSRTRQVRHVRWRPASGRLEHFFDDEPVPGTQGVTPELLRHGRALPDERARALRHRVPLRLRRRALPGRADRRRAAVARRDGAAAARALRRAGPRRHLPQSRDRAARTRARPSSTSSSRSGC